MTQAQNSARHVAVQVLFRVMEKGAWAAPTLDAELKRAGLASRDAALATEIVYGTLRVLPRLDAALGPFLKAPARLDTFVRVALLAGVYQLHHLSRVPPYAVVSECVDVVRDGRGPRLAGLANAVLRKVAEGAPPNRSPPTRLAVPSWLSATLQAALGGRRAPQFLETRSLPPPIGLRARGDRDAVIERLRQDLPEGGSLRPGLLTPHSILLWSAGDPRRLPGYEEGDFAIQEQGAQAIADFVGAQPGDRVLDGCAGRGGKTAVLVERVGPTGRVTAVDLHEPKLERMAAELTRLRLGAARVETRAIDLSVGLGGLPEGGFDRVLVDAPCTGIGTVHRRPEVLLRLAPDDPSRVGAVQRQILERCARLVKRGGTLIYAVCSPTTEEGPEVADHLRRVLPEFESDPLPAADPDGGRRVGPWDDESDAYQSFRWRRRAV